MCWSDAGTSRAPIRSPPRSAATSTGWYSRWPIRRNGCGVTTPCAPVSTTAFRLMLLRRLPCADHGDGDSDGVLRRQRFETALAKEIERFLTHSPASELPEMVRRLRTSAATRRTTRVTAVVAHAVVESTGPAQPRIPRLGPDRSWRTAMTSDWFIYRGTANRATGSSDARTATVRVFPQHVGAPQDPSLGRHRLLPPDKRAGNHVTDLTTTPSTGERGTVPAATATGDRGSRHRKDHAGDKPCLRTEARPVLRCSISSHLHAADRACTGL